MRFFERFLRVLYQIGADKEESRRAKRRQLTFAYNSQSFSNPAFIPSTNINSTTDFPNVKSKFERKSHSNKSKKCLKRSKSCPIKKLTFKPIVPKIRL